MAVRGLSVDGVRRTVYSIGEIRTATLIYIHGKTESERPTHEAREKLGTLLVDKGLLRLQELVMDRNVVAILIDDDERMASKIVRTLKFEYALKDSGIGFIIYKVKDYAIREQISI